MPGVGRRRTGDVSASQMERRMDQAVVASVGKVSRRFSPSLDTARIEFKRCLLFVDLPPAGLAAVARTAVRKHLAKGATVFEQDAPATRLFVLLEGRVKAIQNTADGHQVTARFLRSGEPFGCVALMQAERYPVTTIAEVECEVASWDASLMLQLAQSHPQIAINALTYVGSQLRDTQSRLREAVTERAERRIAHTLLRLVRQAGRRTEEGIEISFPISRQDVAEITGSRLYTVSRTLSKWESLGIIKSGRRRIVICLPHRLLSVAEES